jgi:hypothetical protein
LEWQPWVIYGGFAGKGDTVENHAKLSQDNLIPA